MEYSPLIREDGVQYRPESWDYNRAVISAPLIMMRRMVSMITAGSLLFKNASVGSSAKTAVCLQVLMDIVLNAEWTVDRNEGTDVV